MLRRVWLVSSIVAWGFSAHVQGQGSTPVQLTYDRPGTFKWSPTWSPDGDWIAYGYSPSPSGGVYATWKAPSNSGAPIQISSWDPTWMYQQRWSADGQHVYFLRTAPLGIEAPARVPANGGPYTNYGSQPGWAYSPSINGQVLLYAIGPRSPWDQWGVSLVQLATGAERTIVPVGSGAFLLTIAPSGLFAGYQDLWGLRMLAPFGTPYMFVPPSFQCTFRYYFSPEGERLVLLVAYCGGRPWDLRWVTPFSNVSHVFWSGSNLAGVPSVSPCGSFVAIPTTDGGGILLIEILTGVTRQVCSGFCAASEGSLVVWSPFRDEVAWIQTTTTTNAVEVFKVSTGLSPTPAVVGTMNPGSRILIRVRAPGDAALPYLLGASFGTQPGIATPGGRIPLNLDPLLVASMSGGPPFHSFSGTLDASGRADAYLDLPLFPGLIGQRFFLAFVTLNGSPPGGVRSISGAVPVFVQPL